jgi:hypothetical protein
MCPVTVRIIEHLPKIHDSHSSERERNYFKKTKKQNTRDLPYFFLHHLYVLKIKIHLKTNIEYVIKKLNLRQNNLFRYPTISGPGGVLVVSKSLQHADFTTFHLNNFMDKAKTFLIILTTSGITHLVQDSQGPIYVTDISLACEYSHMATYRGLENLMTGQ